MYQQELFAKFLKDVQSGPKIDSEHTCPNGLTVCGQFDRYCGHTDTMPQLLNNIKNNNNNNNHTNKIKNNEPVD